MEHNDPRISTVKLAGAAILKWRVFDYLHESEMIESPLLRGWRLIASRSPEDLGGAQRGRLFTDTPPPRLPRKPASPRSWLSPFKRSALVNVDSLMIRNLIQDFCPPIGGHMAGKTMLEFGCHGSEPKGGMSPLRNQSCLSQRLGQARCLWGRHIRGVIRRFIENGIQEALEKQVIAPRDVADFGDASDEGND
jgi:hypothetical protein